ncbi:uncharacterized protein ARMOST_06785 [Armillaria ostoyae]|uniref:Uncharacterized protein n=1 Tax=Armillaria ostoyae TaxID=47428 RepID=A0A284R3Y1_ARMOS|nr:uncharacterized protein ARMOST_06785 [Armillaria ostoyae]
MPSYIRKRLMVACPSINRMWKAVYASIASQDIYITNLAFLDYLCRMVQFQKSIIYHDFIPRFTRSITCFVDLRKRRRERAAKGVYRYLITLPNTLGFQVLFKLVRYISFQLVWTGRGWDPRLGLPVPSLHGITIHARYDRFLSNVSPAYPLRHLNRKTRMHIYFSMIDPGNSMVSWDFTFKNLIQVGVPAHCFGGIIDPGPFEMLVKDGVRYLRQPTYIYETQLGTWDSRNINRRLWVASKGRHRLSCFASLFYRREFKRVQSSLLASCSRTGISSGRPTLLESVV